MLFRSGSGVAIDSRGRFFAGKRIVVALIMVHAALLTFAACRNSFAWTEAGLLPAGIIDWQYGSFDVFRVNPPLVRMWATLPVLAFSPDVPFRGVSVDPRNRAEWDVARSMVDANGEACLQWLAVARIACLPFSLLAMWIAHRWANELFGSAAGTGVLILWTFSPFLIGYGSLISGDAQAHQWGW